MEVKLKHFKADQQSLQPKNEAYLATYSPHWSWGRGSLKMKYCWSLWTKISIQRINNHWTFRLTFNAKFTLCFLHYEIQGSRSQDIQVNKHRKDLFTLLNETFKRKWDSIRELEPIWYIRERRGGTFEKWYSSGNNILRDRFPSLDEPPSTVTVSVSADDRLLRRLKDLDFCTGGWTPFSSKVRSSASSLFKSRYLITLLFVSAMKSLPAKWQEPLPL